MRRHIKLFMMSLGSVAVLLSVSGITFSRFKIGNAASEQAPRPPIAVVYDTGSKKETGLRPGEWRQESVSVVNEGDAPYYVRVRLQIPETKGEPLFKIGRIVSGAFITAAFTEIERGSRTEYWEKIGDYLYYRNAQTGDRLQPGKKTAAVYEAVMLNEYVDAEDEESIIVLAECADKTWQAP